MINKKILVVTSELKFSGPNNVIRYLVNEFVGKGDYNIHLAALRKRVDKRYIEELHVEDNSIHVQNGISSIFYLFYVVLKLKPAVVNTHGIRADLFIFMLSFLLRFKQVATVHNIPHEDYAMRYGRFVGSIMLFFHSFVFKSTKVKKVTVSRHARDSLINAGHAKNVAYVYNGVYCHDFERDRRLSSYGPKTVNILFCGHLTEIKNPLAVATVASENPSYLFTMLGEGPLRKELESLNISNLVVKGRVPNVKDYLSEADVFIMPSRTEGMPMAIIEAMLMGLPIVCSDIPIFRELSKIEDIALFTFSTEVPGDFSTKINLALTFKHNSNRDIALKYFSSEVMMNGYVRVINDW